MASSTDQHGGRIEVRTIRTTTRLNHYLDWPKVGQVCRVERVVKCGAEQRRGGAYGITSAGPEWAGAPGLVDRRGGPRRVRNRPPSVVDATAGEAGLGRLSEPPAPR